ncbi:MAG: hypothetical protein AAB403_13000, partial [Planctomycetota bacterium]
HPQGRNEEEEPFRACGDQRPTGANGASSKSEMEWALLEEGDIEFKSSPPELTAAISNEPSAPLKRNWRTSPKTSNAARPSAPASGIQ